ncbi:MAG: hypothetical protein ACRDJ9_24435, partial [Dehalococcoidia bacterium]
SRLRSLSNDAIVFTIMPPHPSAGTFDGIKQVEQQAGRTRRAYRRLWYRVIGVSDGRDPYELVIDALSPVETSRGRLGTAFSRMAFSFAGGKVLRAASLGQAEMHDAPVPEPAEAGRQD